MDSLWIIFLLLVNFGKFEECQGQELTRVFEAEHQVRCNEAYCVDPSNPPPNCPTEWNCTTIGYRQFLYPVACNCCPYCFDYLEDGDSCQKTSQGVPRRMCGPMLMCVDRGEQQTCGTRESSFFIQIPQNSNCELSAFSTSPNPVIVDGSCSAELAEYNARQETGLTGIADWKPNCNAHGRFSPRQCLPASSMWVQVSKL